MSGSPDHEVFPHATGLALETVKAHSNDHELVLWGSWFCPFVQRVWIALEEKGLDYQYHEVNPYKKEKAFLAINPLGLVPAFEIRGKATLWESTVLLEYLDETYPSPKETHEGHILPPLSDTIQRAKARIAADHISKKLIPSFYTLLQAQSLEEQKHGKENLLQHLGTFVRSMGPASDGPYWGGQQFGLVDILIVPWVLRFTSVMKKYKDFELPHEGGGDGIWDRFAIWENAVLGRESVRKTSSETEKYFQVYRRYAENTSQSEVAKATRAGKALP